MMVTQRTLVEGVWFAMEQAGRLLASAVNVYGSTDYGSAIALAMFAHEELGRSRILLEMADEVHRGSTVDTEAVRKRCKDHVEKQRRGAFSVTYRGNAGEPMADALTVRMQSTPGSADYEAAQATIDVATAAIAMAQPSQRHGARMAAVYLDLAPDGETWIRPSGILKEVAFDRLNAAANDYSVGRQWFVEPLLSTTDERLLAVNPKVLLLRGGRPTELALPPPVWPSMPW